MDKKASLCIIACAILIAGETASLQAANADDQLAEEKRAVALYDGHSFKDAAVAFESLIAKIKPDAAVYYYAAACDVQIGNVRRATQLYQYIVDNFPATTQAKYSQTALESMSASTPASTTATPVVPKTSSIESSNAASAHDSGKDAKYTQMFFESRSRASKKILFIGNSLTYTNQLPIVLAALVTNSGTSAEIRVGEVVEGGWTLDRLFNDSNACKAINLDGPWTHVVLQDQSTTPITSPSSTLYSFEVFGKIIKASGAQPVAFETWSLVNAPDTQDKLKSVYREAANSCGALFVPAGEAFALCRSEHPEINLYIDERHPNVTGTYLAACVFYCKIYGRSPVGLPGKLQAAGMEVSSIDAATALVLQKIALRASSAN